MAFSEDEKNLLLQIKGVGPTVVQRFEEIGISSLTELAGKDMSEITGAVSAMLNSTCWSNSPQSKKAVQAAIDFAKTHQA